jgi:hypothetical protein
MKISEMLPSRFLKKEDVPQPVLVTIANITEEIVDKDTGETKFAMHLQEFERPLLLNSTNIQLAAAICGSDDTDDWSGQKVVLYSDPSIMFAGKITGGLRLRQPKNQKPAKPAPKPAGGVAEMDDDDINF